MKHTPHIQKAAFRNEMAKTLMPLNEKMIDDGNPHEYWVNIKDKKEKASYTVMLYPFGTNPGKPVLIGWYGLIHGNNYFYSSHSN